LDPLPLFLARIVTLNITTESGTEAARSDFYRRSSAKGFKARISEPHAGEADWVAWQFPGGPVGSPARWAATSDVEGGSGTEEGPLAKKGGLYSNKLFAWVPEFLVTPLLVGRGRSA